MTQTPAPPLAPNLGPIPRRVRPLGATIVNSFFFTFFLLLWALATAVLVFVACCFTYASFGYTASTGRITALESKIDQNGKPEYFFKYAFQFCSENGLVTSCGVIMDTQSVNADQFNALSKIPTENRQLVVHHTEFPFFKTTFLPGFSSPAFSIAITWLLSSFFLIALYCIGHHYRRQFIRIPRLLARGTPVYGSISRKYITTTHKDDDTSINNTKTITTYHIDCTFLHPATNRSTTIESQTDYPTWQARREGDRITVLYDPADPDLYTTLEFGGYKIVF